MKRVWMNHWFSTALNIIDLMRQDYVDLCIIGSNENEYTVIKNGIKNLFLRMTSTLSFV